MAPRRGQVVKRRGDGARLATELLDRAQQRANYRILVAGSASVDNFMRAMAAHGRAFFTGDDLAVAIKKGVAS